MPPRKRARHSQATSPSPSQKSPELASSPPTKSPPPQDTSEDTDAWTDHEETGLFKALMIFKPTGLHKHFRLLALHDYLLSNQYIHPRNSHTKPKGIRKKLESLYNMDALDAREDARQLPPYAEVDGGKDDDIYSQAGNRIEGEEFALPAEGDEEGFFEREMWERRLAENGGEDSDVEMPELNLAEEPPVRFVATVSIEPSEAATPGSRKGRSNAAGARRKSVQGKSAVGTTTTTRRSARQVASEADEEEVGEQQEEKEKEEAGGDEEEEEVEHSGSEDQSQASNTPAPRTSSRSTKGMRGRGNARAGRARGKK